ncbi:MAG TPA: DUF1778 domain-containing protein [Archangium sp.]|nr:DUF1778 domain-containing protein [Archangium sp.]
MRLQASISDALYAQAQKLGAELGLNMSQVTEEAFSLLAKTILEMKRGYRVAFVREGEPGMVREYSSPVLTQLELNQQEAERIVLPDADFDRLQGALESPPEPNAALRALSRKRQARPKKR